MKTDDHERAERVSGAILILALVAMASTAAAHDHTALQAIVDFEGPGSMVQIPPGTYDICQALVPLDGQIWDLEGVTLRRCDAVISTLTAPALVGQTTVEVEDASIFELGQRITPIKGPGRLDGEQSELHRISAIDGNTITFWNGLDQGYSVGDSLIVIEDMFKPDAYGLRWTLLGGTFDGNRRENMHHVSWEFAGSVTATGDGVLVDGVTFVDCWGSCFNAGGGGGLYNATVSNSTFDTGAGAAIHFSKTENVSIEDSTFKGFNVDAVLSGHSEGTITWSLNNRDAVISGVCIEDQVGGMFAVGVAPFTKNAGIEIADSRFCRTPGGFGGNLWGVPEPAYLPTTGDIDIHDNHFVDSGLFRLFVNPEDPTLVQYLDNVSFVDNVLVDSDFDFSDVPDAVLTGNVVSAGPAPCSCDAWQREAVPIPALPAWCGWLLGVLLLLVGATSASRLYRGNDD